MALPQDPGSAGVIATSHIARTLAGYGVMTTRISGPKPQYAQPLLGMAENHNLSLVRGSWNSAFLDEVLAFGWGTLPKRRHGGEGT